MDNSSLIQLVSVVITAVASSGAVAALFNRRNRQERQIAVSNLQATTDNITTQAAATALRALRRELDAANADLDRRRAVIDSQDERIDSQQRQIRQLRREVQDLREFARAMQVWVRDVSEEMRQNKLSPPPLPIMPAMESEFDEDM